ncbi:phosphotransferase [Methyloligella sp. 2.7D]|uniref:phosphotransferase n=1 Tax=unclassified Methyloligella TaxID=2625955 RepID=UPI00157C0C9A|nr:phosphotransferase [Methyloligella sp. GL2]QKP75994.1 phosphotransferase [Methyloligella sp. GL2]
MIEPGWTIDAIKAYIGRLPLWSGEPAISPMAGGLTNLVFLVEDGDTNYVARVGFDLPDHDMYDVFIQTAMRAAAEIGVAPAIRYIEPRLAVMDFVPGGTLRPETASEPKNMERAIGLLRRLHQGTGAVRGPIRYVCYFQHTRGYVALLRRLESRVIDELPRYDALLDTLEKEISPFTPVLTQNDPLPQNFLGGPEDELKLVDWDHGGIGHPFNDLSSFLNNADVPLEQWDRAIEICCGEVDDRLRYELSVFAVVAALREYIWAPVQELVSHVPEEVVAASMQELHPDLPAGYEGYGIINYERFEKILSDHEQKYGKVGGARQI